MKRTRDHDVEVLKVIPQERMQSYTVEQIVDVPVPQIRKETGEVIQFIPKERISDLLENSL